MPIDAAKALAAEPRTGEIVWGHQDVQLYHLGLGAGTPATDLDELRYTLESRLHVLPSFATVAGNGSPGVISGLSMPGVEVDLARVLHGGQSLTLHRPIPVPVVTYVRMVIRPLKPDSTAPVRPRTIQALVAA